MTDMTDTTVTPREAVGVPEWLELIVTDAVAALELGSEERRVLVQSAAHVLPRAARVFDASDWDVMETRLRRTIVADTDALRFVGAESHPHLMVAGLEVYQMLLARERRIETGGVDDAEAETHHRREAWWQLDLLATDRSASFGGRGRRVLDLMLVPVLTDIQSVLALAYDRTACVAALLVEIERRVADMAAVAQEASS